jgi:hypothetical protein
MPPPQRQVRADYDAWTIVVYQAYAPAIADPAVLAQRFVPPFSFRRMTWIKPSFRWLMHRSNWAAKAGQERILAVRITREGWEHALSVASLTTGDPDALALAGVHVQWDPERSLRGAALNHYSIQVGIGSELARTFAGQWVTAITDITPQVRTIGELVHNGQTERARWLLPPERPYQLPAATARRLLADR